MASNLSFGSGVVVISSSQAHLTRVSTLSGPGTARIRPVIRDDRRRAGHRCPGFPLPFGRRHSLLGSSCSRRGVEPSSRSAYRADDRPGPRRGFHVPHVRDYDRGGCPLYPGDGGALPAGTAYPTGACRFPAASPCTPLPHPIAGLAMTRHHRGSLRSPVRSSPRLWPPDGTGALGLSPELRTPPLPATHVRVGTGLEHWPGTTPPTSVGPPIREFTRIVRPRVATAYSTRTRTPAARLERLLACGRRLAGSVELHFAAVWEADDDQRVAVAHFYANPMELLTQLGMTTATSQGR